ncbi:glycosyltransferase family protein [Seohaeicola zhoushanensis]|uniref:Glycosyl transferase n=1 Tax=Seohaeicola zhoushanensis TaxID=1569283 RepID=A0A8J3GVN5_9RHOB|nr:glycosyltransferase [Seohaeicola zhoushanensis]GHF40039.1 glycosyl transferase [Seohaeicola zhoushanensis]
MKVLIAVTHLLGTGHLARALTLGRAFAARGHAVRIASGGMAVPQFDLSGVELVQLPPLRSDGTAFTRLLASDGTLADDGYHARRRDMLVAEVRDHAPDILITELFPFGRRALRAEFRALLDAAHALPRRPVVLASIRDILAPPSKPERVAQTEVLVLDHYDAVLVHSDPAVVPLDLSWPVSAALTAKLRYTGFVAPPPPEPHPEGLGTGEVLVSAGGGPVGQRLFQTAIAAARADKRTWRLMTRDMPPNLPPNVVIDPPRPDFRALLANAAASVSMCGYNTAMDLLQTGVPGVIVPFDAGGEQEQGLRAGALSRMPGLRILRDEALSPKAMLAALAEATADPSRTATPDFDGARHAVDIAVTLAEARP